MKQSDWACLTLFICSSNIHPVVATMATILALIYMKESCQAERNAQHARQEARREANG